MRSSTFHERFEVFLEGIKLAFFGGNMHIIKKQTHSKPLGPLNGALVSKLSITPTSPCGAVPLGK
jgi:hypothetical protein